MKLPFEKWI